MRPALCGEIRTFGSLPQSMIERERLGISHVESRPCEPARPHRLEQILGCHDGPARDVDEIGLILHQSERRTVDHPEGLAGQGNGQHHEVGSTEEFVPGDELLLGAIIRFHRPDLQVRDSSVVPAWPMGMPPRGRLSGPAATSQNLKGTETCNGISDQASRSITLP